MSDEPGIGQKSPSMLEPSDRFGTAGQDDLDPDLFPVDAWEWSEPDATNPYLRLDRNLLIAASADDPDNPAEGDSRLYLDDDELILERYDGAAWEKVVHVGGEDGTDVLRPGMLARLLGHLDAPDVGGRVPDARALVFDFDNDAEDQWGSEDLWNTPPTAFSATAKFGSHSATSDMTASSVVPQDTEDFALAFWLRLSDLPSSDDVLWKAETDASNAFRLRVLSGTPAGGVTLEVEFAGTSVAVTSSHAGLSAGIWHFIGVIWDASADTAYLIVDDTVDSNTNATAPGGSSTWPWEFEQPTGVTTKHVDDLLWLLGTDVAPATSVFTDHYTRNIPWTQTTATDDDLLIAPAVGERVVGLGGLTLAPPAAQYVTETNATLSAIGPQEVWVDTGSADRTITVPSGVTAVGSDILIAKVDSGSGNVIISGGTFGVNSVSSMELWFQGNWVRIKPDTSGHWWVVGTEMFLIPDDRRTDSWLPDSGTETAWTDVDYSARVPPGTHLVKLIALLQLNGDGATGEMKANFRANGSSENGDIQTRGATVLHVPVLAVGEDAREMTWPLVELDSSGVFEYKVSGSAGNLWCSERAYQLG